MSEEHADAVPGKTGFTWWTHSTAPPEFLTGPPPEEPEEPEAVDLWRTVGDVRPWGTAVLLLSWCALFAALALTRAFDRSSALAAWGASLSGPEGWREPWRWLSYSFLHAGTAHLFFNGLAFALYGPAVERVLTRWHFWLVYAGGAAVAALGSLVFRAWISPDARGVSVGASGAIFALGGALLAAAWRLRRRLAPGRGRALAGSLVLLLSQGLVAGFTHRGTDNGAHLAGLLFGVGLGSVLGLDPRLGERGPNRFTRALGLIALVALAAALLRAVAGGITASAGAG